MNRWDTPVTPSTISAFLRILGIGLLLAGLLVLNVLLIAPVGQGAMRAVILITDVFVLASIGLFAVDLLYHRKSRHLDLALPASVASLDEARARITAR